MEQSTSKEKIFYSFLFLALGLTTPVVLASRMHHDLGDTFILAVLVMAITRLAWICATIAVAVRLLFPSRGNHFWWYILIACFNLLAVVIYLFGYFRGIGNHLQFQQYGFNLIAGSLMFLDILLVKIE